MAELLKILGQAIPSDTFLATTVYTVPAATMTTVSSITVCNIDTVARTFKMSVIKSGEGTNNKQFIFFDQEIGPKSTFVVTIGLTLSAGDKINVVPSTANQLAFNIFGIEVS